jgi:hypothetical protein
VFDAAVACGCVLSGDPKVEFLFSRVSFTTIIVIIPDSKTLFHSHRFYGQLLVLTCTVVPSPETSSRMLFRYIKTEDFEYDKLLLLYY